MNTYKRKRPEYQLIENIDQLCRLCLDNGQEMLPIFGAEEDVYNKIVTRVMMCVGIAVTKEQDMPHKICLPCYNELDRIYTYRKKCEACYIKLKSHVMAIADRDTRKAVGSLQEQEIQGVEGQVCLTEQVVDTDKTTTGSFEQMITKEVIVTESDTLHITAALCDQQIRVPEEKEHISLSVISKLIEKGVLSAKCGGLVLADQNVNLSNIILELLTSDSKVMNLEIFEESNGKRCNVEEEHTAESEVSTDTDEENSEQEKLMRKNKKKAWCARCDKSFATRAVMERHVRSVHGGKRPYVCQSCDRTFSQQEILQRHEHVHLENKPFPCPECDKAYTQLRSLRQHQRTHLPPQARTLYMHRCKICPKVFLYASGLTRHMISHKSARRFRCEHCLNPYYSRSSLSRHLKQRHPPPTLVVP